MTGTVDAAAPTPAQALSLKPIQAGVEIDRPGKDEVAGCTISPEKAGGRTAWVVRAADGRVLRRFSDTNRDNVVDEWCYFKDGVEVYRDVDSDHDSKADEYRWYNTAGTRRGADTNQDGAIDRWNAISPHEVAEQLVDAIQSKDLVAFRALLLSGDELKRLGVGKALRQQISRSVAAAPGKFKDLVGGKPPLSADARFADLGVTRPNALPAGTDGSTRDVIVHQNATALVDAGGKVEQVQIGLLVRVGDAWRLVQGPQVGDESVEFGVAATLTGASAGGDDPTEKMQRLMEQLERLDQQTIGSGPKEQAALFGKRADMLRKLAAATPKGSLRDQWYNQLADMFSAAVIEGQQKNAATLLERLDKEVQDAGAGVDAQAHVRFQRLYTDWVVRGQDPKVDYARLQEDWRKQLQAFAKEFPSSPDTAEALLQLGMVDDLAGRDEDAQKWYTRLARDFDSTPRGDKAAGALRRLGSPGKAIPLAGAGLTGGRLDLKQYRGKMVAVQYWATWCEPCKQDMKLLKELVAKYGGKGFAVLAVNLDSERADAQQYVKKNRLPWKHLHEPGGLEGRLANEMGVINLPLMLLIDKQGKVVSRNLRADEIEAELRKVIR